ncbi:MAG: SH3 domain-containing protein [Lachnospiraceae bacterium]|nr:SH3 domain-containing protein [Lachnospiraceae bacterium]
MKHRYRLVSGFVLAVLAIVWVVFLTVNEDKGASSETKDTMVTQLNSIKEKIKEQQSNAATPTLEPTDIPTVTPEPTDEPVTPAPTPIVLPEYTKFDYILANVNEKMNVREGAGQNKKVVGSLPANGYGKVIERGTEWFKIKSGDVTGYVSTQYILTDTEAINKMRELDALKLTITGTDVNVRTEPNTTCEIKLQAKNGTVYDYYPEFSTQLFYAILIDGEICYVSNSYSEVTIKLETATK